MSGLPDRTPQDPDEEVDGPPRSPLIAVYDACVLYPFALRNILVQLAADRIVDARWSPQIHDEWIRNLSQRGSNPPPRAELERTRSLMDMAVPRALVTGHERRISDIELQDPDDRHVVAAALEACASIVVSQDRHLSSPQIEPYGLRRMKAGGFLMDLFAHDPEGVLASLARARANLRKSRPSPEEFVERLRATGTVDGFCDILKHHLDAL